MQLVPNTRDALLKPLSTVAGIVERRHTLPILANILMRKEGQQGGFHRHRPRESRSPRMPTSASARRTGPPRWRRAKLLDILKALPNTGEVKLGLASNKLSVQSAKSRFALQTLAASEFPTVAQPEKWDVR